MNGRLSFSRAAVIASALLATLAVGAAEPLPVTPQPPLSSVGRWFVDATGRVILLHGVNDVAKVPPYYSAARGFGADDVAFLASEGFNALRLGIDMRGLMPEPGQLDAAYVENLVTTVDDCVAGGLFVLLDFHQDGYAPKYNGNGFPNWMAIDDGLPNPPDAVFPLYYVQNPAMQRAFEHFWHDSAIPGGDPLHDYYLQALSAIAGRFGDEPMVLGTEVMNEPWPGAVWQPCVLDPAGCPALEAELKTKVFDFDYDPARVGGGHFPRRLDTLVFVPKRHYPNGYNVEVSGARVMSEPCATELRLRTKRTRRPPRRVLVRITPGLSGRDRSCP
jgi:endoglycosylceramidase